MCLFWVLEPAIVVFVVDMHVDVDVTGFVWTGWQVEVASACSSSALESWR